MQIQLENIRSFCGTHIIPVRPLTLLIGENSTGKTTFLSMLAHVSQPGFASLRPSFNIAPFDLGTFDSIVTFKGGSFGRAESFSVGFTQAKNGEQISVLATYVDFMGQPQLSRLLVNGLSSEILFELSRDLSFGKVLIKGQTGSRTEFPVSFKKTVLGDLPVIFLLRNLIFERAHQQGKVDLMSETVIDTFSALSQMITPIFALAPVRTKPKRTYDEISDEFRPEGDHIPVLLARTWQEEGEARVFEALQEFGEISSLFRDIRVRRLGKKPSDPFQIMVTVAGPAANLPDVGYGVSQALPIIVQSVLAPRKRMLLLQQPEVHLHPRSQAALGSFFARLVSREKKQFVVETHSDYLIDRIRQEVAKGNISPDEVLILFFEKEEIETQVHQIKLDPDGSLVGVPESYRRFFLEEELSLLSRANK